MFNSSINQHRYITFTNIATFEHLKWSKFCNIFPRLLCQVKSECSAYMNKHILPCSKCNFHFILHFRNCPGFYIYGCNKARVLCCFFSISKHTFMELRESYSISKGLHITIDYRIYSFALVTPSFYISVLLSSNRTRISLSLSYLN